MAIVKDLTITVNGNQSKLSKDVYLYLGDGGITLLITVLEDSFRFGTFKSDGSNIVEDSNTVFAKVCILKANNEIVYSDKCAITNGKIRFEISKNFIDEIAEMGTHLLQVHLYDGEDENSNRLTIPPVSIEILKPICDYEHDKTDTP